MAIKMDGNVITDLLLKASDGTEVSKALTEEYSGSKEITANGTYDVRGFASAIVNVEGGVSQGYATGSFTPAEAVLAYTISTGLSEVHGLCIQYNDPANTSSGKRVLCSVIADLVNNIIYSVGSNAAGTNMASVGSPSAVAITTDGGNVTVTSSNGNGGGYFVPMLYRWYAW